jgi:hypothetical protein
MPDRMVLFRNNSRLVSLLCIAVGGAAGVHPVTKVTVAEIVEASITLLEDGDTAPPAEGDDSDPSGVPQIGSTGDVWDRVQTPVGSRRLVTLQPAHPVCRPVVHRVVLMTRPATTRMPSAARADRRIATRPHQPHAPPSCI